MEEIAVEAAPFPGSAAALGANPAGSFAAAPG